MALSLDYEFSYESLPVVAVAILSPLTGTRREIEAIIDTDADTCLLDSQIATDLGLEPGTGRRVRFGGVVSGAVALGFVHQVDILVLGYPLLTTPIDVTFAENVATTCGNLLGLEFLNHFDFGLSHVDRIGYLGRLEAARS